TSSDFLEANRPVLAQRAASGQTDGEGSPRVEHAARTLGADFDRVEEALNLGAISGREPIDEILIARLVRRFDPRLQRTERSACIQSHGDAVAQPEQLHTDVVPAWIVPHRRNGAEDAAFEFQ